MYRFVVLATLCMTAAVLGQATSTSAPAIMPGSRIAPLKTTTFPLSRMKPLELSKISPKAQAAFWDAFRHEPFDKAGFNPVALPMRYSSVQGLGSQEEGLAFSFLLSNALDWVPGNYCSRHAYFVFRNTNKPSVKDLMEKYDAQSIAGMIDGWDATHAVGGQITRSREGYSGKLEIYGPDGKLVLGKDYTDARPYFDLLRDMSVDAAKYFGHDANDALKRHWGIVRCSAESIEDLGKAAFLSRGSDEEKELVERILERDPGFAELRYWAANQKQWIDGDRKEYERQKTRALDDYLVPNAIADFDLHGAEPEVFENVERWVRRSEKLAGKDHPLLVRTRLRLLTSREKPVPGDMMAHATQVASRYPNEYWLLYELAGAYGSQYEDRDMAASTAMAASQSRFLTATTDKYHVRKDFVCFAASAGFPRFAAPEMAAIIDEKAEQKRETNGWERAMYAECLLQSGQLDNAARAYEQAAFAADRKTEARSDDLTDALILAIIRGDKEDSSRLVTLYGADILKCGNPPLVEAYQLMAEGQRVSLSAVSEKPDKNWAWEMRECILKFQLDQMRGMSKFRDQCRQVLQRDPDNRIFWFLYDAYDQAEPWDECGAFYQELNFLHGDDPWVVEAVRDYARRGGTVNLPDADSLLRLFEDYDTERYPARRSEKSKEAWKISLSLPPGTVGAVIQKLMKARRTDKAMELALRYHHLAVDCGKFKDNVHTNHLVHVVERARRTTTTTPAKVSSGSF